eukprot:scaffold11692_cov97-Isochrysis_galbana.AAC.4
MCGHAGADTTGGAHGLGHFRTPRGCRAGAVALGIKFKRGPVATTGGGWRAGGDPRPARLGRAPENNYNSQAYIRIQRIRQHGSAVAWTEQSPADARAAPSAPGPTDMVTETPPSPKRPRDPFSGNKVSQRATTFDPVWPESQIMTTGNLSTALANACQSEPCTSHHPYGSVAQVCRLLGSSL